MKYISRLTALLLAFAFFFPSLVSAQSFDDPDKTGLTRSMLDALYEEAEGKEEQVKPGVLGDTVTLEAFNTLIYKDFIWYDGNGNVVSQGYNTVNVTFTMEEQRFVCHSTGNILGIMEHDKVFIVPPAQTSDMNPYLDYLYNHNTQWTSHEAVYSFMMNNWNVTLDDGSNLGCKVIAAWNDPESGLPDNLFCTCVALGGLNHRDPLLSPDGGHLSNCPWVGINIIPPIFDQVPNYEGAPDGAQYTATEVVTLTSDATQPVVLPEGGRAVITYAPSTLQAQSRSGAGRNWQIFTGNEWVDILGDTSATIVVTEAKLASIIEVAATARLRYYDADSNIVLASASVSNRSLANINTVAETTPVTLSVQNRAANDHGAVVMRYRYVDPDSKLNTNAVGTDNTWTVPIGTALRNQNVTIPNVMGYDAYIPTGGLTITPAGMEGISVVAQKNDTNDPERITGFTINIDNVTENVEIIVPYKRATDTLYTVNRYVQNLTDDLYAFDEGVVEPTSEYSGTTESPVGGEHVTNDDGSSSWTNDAKIAPSIDGFKKAVYDGSEAIGADGETVVEVYYDRMYYLMSIDQNGGYGAQSVYAKYGATISVATPNRPGYIFGGWQQTDQGGNALKDTNGNELDPVMTLPTKMGLGNTWYKAVWKLPTTADVTVVFWGENPNDEEYSVVHSATISTTPGEPISYADGKWQVCGIEAGHTHTSCTLDCTHVCTIECYSDGNNWDNWETTSDPNTSNSGTALGGGATYYSVTRSGGWSSTDYWYIHLANGSWYRVEQGNSNPSWSCTHTHNDSCYSCGQVANHTHTDACMKAPMDTDLWTLVDAGSVTVNPDGTSILNVRFDRTEFTLHFRRAQSSTDDYGTIVAKWGENIGSQWDQKNTDAGTALWSAEYDGSGPWTGYLDIMPEENRTYYRNNSSTTNTHTATYYVEDLNGNDTVKFTISVKYSSSNLDVTEEDRFPIEGFTHNYDRSTSNDSSFNNAKFYYTRNSYKMQFYNYDSIMEDKTVTAKYEAPLAEHNFTPDYPKDLQYDGYGEQAYVFAGWYTDPYFVNEMDWNSTMPAGPNDGDVVLILYAKWEPKTYTVTIFDDADDAERYYAGIEKYGEYYAPDLGALDPSDAEDAKIFAYIDSLGENSEAEKEYLSYVLNYTPKVETVKYNEYAPKHEFPVAQQQMPVGWFYKVNGVEYTFDFSMPITRDLDIYVKWETNVLKDYILRYALDADADGKPDTDSTTGQIIFLAEQEMYSGLATSMHTHDAKYGSELKQNPDDTQLYFPVTNSHSITLELTEEATSRNEWFDYIYPGTDTPVRVQGYTFLYRPIQPVWYKVHYVTKTMPEGWTVPEGTGDGIYTDENGNVYYKLLPDHSRKTEGEVIVTEDYKYIANYVPDKYQKTLILSATEAENVIVFVYTYDEANAPVRVEHYVEDVSTDADGDWLLYRSIESLREPKNQPLKDDLAAILTIEGYTFNKATAQTGNQTAETAEDVTSKVNANNIVVVTVPEGGLVLRVYYTANLYPYEYRYLEAGTDAVLAAPENGEAAFKAVVTGKEKEIAGYTRTRIVHGGYDRTNTEMVIQVEEGTTAVKNVVILYYEKQQTTITYKVVQRPLAMPGSVWLSNDTDGEPQENNPLAQSVSEMVDVYVTDQQDDAVVGAKVKPRNEHFEFYGWYLDEACTEPVTDEHGTIKEGVFVPNATVPYEVYDPDNEKANDNGMVTVMGYPADGLTFYARFTYNTYTLKLVKTGLQKDETVIFTVTAVSAIDAYDEEGNKAKVTTYTIAMAAGTDGTAAVNIAHLIAGTDYTIHEEMEWAWKYQMGIPTVNGTPLTKVADAADKYQGTLPEAVPTADTQVVTVTVSNTLKNDKWLHDEGMLSNHMDGNVVEPREGQ